VIPAQRHPTDPKQTRKRVTVAAGADVVDLEHQIFKEKLNSQPYGDGVAMVWQLSTR
jgi:hypothetical protein